MAKKKKASQTPKKKVVKRERPLIKSITIAISGANNIQIENQVGRPIGEIRQALATVLNIAPDAKARIGGEEVNDSHVIKQGEKLEFVKEGGGKGC